MYKFLAFFFVAIVAVNAQHYFSPTITSQDQNTYRTFGNLGQISTQSKTIDTPFSSVRKSDVRVSNPGYAVATAPIAHAAYAPIAHHGYAGYPHAAYGHAAYAAPVAKAVAPALLGVAYSAAPVVSHMTYTSGLGYNYAW